jgi:23S rRNA pseudouridine1911/1915/1917 synthase
MGRPQTITLSVGLDDAGARADVVLGRRVPSLSRRAARAMALEGRLRLDGHRVGPSARVRVGQVLELSWNESGSTVPADPLRVTDDFVYVNKPSGVHTHRLRPSDPPALGDAVIALYPECASASSDAREQGAVHRLDRTTSGVVAFARSPSAWAAARRGLSEGSVEKIYLAICRPRPADASHELDVEASIGAPVVQLPTSLRGMLGPAARITAPLGRGDGRGRVAVRPDGLEALTILWRLDVGQGTSELVACLLRLSTGRRHQARVHLAHVGLPIVGDPLYGDASGAHRPLLHALSLDLSACCRGESPVQAPVAPDISAYLPCDVP